jgi:hypothetical protein
MRIVIEHDTASTTSTASTAASVAAAPVAQVQTENAGAAPDISSGGHDAAGDDGGGPPQWLLDAVGRAMATESFTSSGNAADVADGGAAPKE